MKGGAMTSYAVTGAFGYSGKYIASRLLAQGETVRTLTNSMHREHPFGDRVEAFPLSFHDPERLAGALAGVEVLINTYWVRFNHRDFTHAQAVDNTLELFRAARRAGVHRVVHVSITNPSADSELEYFRGKAVLEQALRESGLSYAILRPAVLFGKEDVLINNIAWVLRTFPIFGLFGGGGYRLQPIHVDDFAALAVAAAAASDDLVINAIGPETYKFRDLVQTIALAIGKERKMISISPRLGGLVATLLGGFLGDTILTREEIAGLMDDLLYVNAPATGSTRLSEWTRAHSDTLGIHYTSELARRKNRENAYQRA